jgi:hypothetical protein
MDLISVLEASETLPKLWITFINSSRATDTTLNENNDKYIHFKYKYSNQLETLLGNIKQ